MEKPEKIYIQFTADINDESARGLDRAIADIRSIGIQNVHLLLSSNGGNVDVGIEMHNILKSMPFHLTTHNIGTVDSIANVVFLAGEERLATQNARFMMHGVARTFRADPNGRVSLGAQELKEALGYVERDQRRIAETIARFSSLKAEEIMRIMDGNDTLYNPTEAQNLGLIHRVEEIGKINEEIIRIQ